jgi:hypothetical protein
MQPALRIFWDIALWRRSPRDLPASWSLLVAAALAYVLLSIVQSLVIFGPTLAVERGLADLALTALVFGGCLAVRRRGNRTLQTLTAVLATGAVISLPMLALMLAAQALGTDGPLALAIQFGLLPLQVWLLLALGRIVRLALDTPLLTGMAVAMTYLVLNYLLLVELPRAVAS